MALTEHSRAGFLPFWNSKSVNFAKIAPLKLLTLQNHFTDIKQLLNCIVIANLVPRMIRIRTLILFGTLAATLASCSSNSESEVKKLAHNVMLMQPEVAGSAQTRTYSATVQEARSISVGFKTAGQIKRLLVKEGDYVHQGQLLAVLDTVDYALGLKQLRVQHSQQKNELERRRQLHAAHNLSDNDFERFEAGYDQLSAQLALQTNKLSYCRLKAPASGYITKLNFEVSEMVDAGTPVFELMDNSHLEVLVDLPVVEYMNRGEFQSFVGHTPLRPDEAIPLKMVSLTPRADNNQLYQLKLVVDAGAKAQLTAGMNMSVDISMRNAANRAAATDKSATDNADNKVAVAGCASIPAAAVFENKGKSCVWKFNPADSTVTVTPVTVFGVPDASGMVFVSEGITPGMQIVRAGVNHLTNGEKVHVIDQASETNVGNLL